MKYIKYIFKQPKYINYIQNIQLNIVKLPLDIKHIVSFVIFDICVFQYNKPRSVGVVAYMLLSGGVSPFYSGASSS